MDTPTTRDARSQSTPGVGAWIGAHPLAAYLLIAYTLSWACWVPLALGVRTVEPGVGWPSQLPGLTGPAISALIVTALVGGKAGLVDLWLRVTRWRVGWWWLSVVVLVVAGAIAVATAGDFAAGDVTLFNGISSSIGPLLTIVLVFVLNGLGEEVGWRGFLADHLLQRHGLTATALLVALAWAPWHAPIFFLVASMRGLAVPELVGWALGLTAGSFVLTWLYRGSGSSILLVAVWHTVFNFTSGATPAGSGPVAAVTSTLVMTAAVAIVVVESRRGRRRTPAGARRARAAGRAEPQP